MKRSFLLFMLIFISLDLLAELPEIAPQRMITDYNGIAYSEDIILCYGDYGIITYSEDLGYTWSQINIGNEHYIKKIIYNNGLFKGVTNSSYIYSTDGINWNLSELETEGNIISFAVANNDNYILASDGIYLYKNNIIKKKFNLDDNSSYTNFESDSTFLYFVENDTKLLRYNIVDNSTEIIINDITNTTISKNVYNKLTQLKILNNNIYVASQNKSDPYKSKNILVSNNKGNSWKKIINNDKNKFYTYFAKDTNVYYIDYAYPFYQMIYEDYDTLGNKYALTMNKIIDSNNIKIVSKQDYVFDKNFFDYQVSSKKDIINEVKIFQDSIIILAGINKSIFISYDFGKSFECKSHLRESDFKLNYKYLLRFPTYFYFLNDNIVTSNLHRSTNNGATWLPREINKNNVKDMFNVFNGAQNMFTNKISDEIVFTFLEHSPQELYFFRTNDYGKNYNINMVNPIKGYENSIWLNGTIINDNIIFPFHNMKGYNNHTLVYGFDENLSLKSTKQIDSIKLKQIFNYNDIKLVTIGEQNIGYLYTEDGVKYYEKSNNLLLESFDYGKNWDVINLNGKIEISDYHYKYKDYIFIKKHDTEVIKYIDLKNNKLDSFNLPAPISGLNLQQNIFEFKGKLFFISNEYNLYYTSNFDFNNSQWEIIEFSKYFANWDPYDRNNFEINKNSIYAAYPDESNNQIYLITGLSKEDENGKYLSMNIIKLFKGTQNNVEETEIKNYLYNYVPYPQPASTEVRSLVYWDTSLEMNKENIKIYNINGIEVGREQDISLEKINSYSGNIIWNCTNVPDGVYLIQISHGSKKRTIKVMVKK